MNEEKKQKLTDAEMIELQESISEGVQDFFDNYDWDGDFRKNIGNKPNPE